MRRVAALSVSVFAAGLVLGGTSSGAASTPPAPAPQPPAVVLYEGPGAGDLPVVTGPFDAR